MAKRYDIVVVGGGHAGIEAAWAAATLGARTALVTMQLDAIGRMSCNPAIGGIGKGHMVREIDALGGLMGLVTDRAGIQFRMLNRSKGPAVWAPRAQCDRQLYSNATRDLLAGARNLEILEGSVEDLHVHAVAQPAAGGPVHRITGAQLAEGRRLACDAVILTTGTFLRGLMHCGERQTAGGRVGEAPAVGISRVLESLGLTLGRLKTGTPPRLHRDTLDYAQLEEQPGDDVPIPFSFLTDGLHQRQVPCWITYTNGEVHGLIRENLHRAPMYSGQIQSTGPRYCPSIEDKVVRFADKDRHQIFLEPEGYESERIYCNGISTSLPADVQEDMIRRIPALRDARILQHGYAVEYDWVPTHQTKFSLETKRVAGLFLAGQINGTSGYEEAAGQGILAGINAVMRLKGEEALILRRDQAYLGVMIDDLITRPQIEPYRMFTSRAEHRLSLRSDNADQRLTPIGRRLGLVDDRRWALHERKEHAVTAIRRAMRGASVDGSTLASWLKRPDALLETFADALHTTSGRTFGADDLWEVMVRAKYEGYLQRQDRHIERLQKLESHRIPDWVDFSTIPQLKAEARENLARVRPMTLGQAGRIPGISSADLTVLWVMMSQKTASPSS
ncbi:MAG: tRNA uridine-5-carboxymethylaminomethyl(34) synthesis enzyme MnmG [Phycisphaerales bacterium]|nr:tRNA uridine-5-carboxymethylaminomethyl(34) synthesis enzyme MnmG [Phycisphaerales bacterium]